MFELIAAVCLKIVKLLFTCFAFSTICSWLVKLDSKEVCGRGVGALLAFCALLLLFGDDSRLSGLDNFGVEDASWPIWENTEKVTFNEKFVTFLNNQIYYSLLSQQTYTLLWARKTPCICICRSAYSCYY